jgi:alanyl-tRNA synthetase
LKTKELRKAFLDYFASKGHSVIDSASLVPEGDPTLLFTNAGMVQFKDCFLGLDKRPYVRAATCQKCLRISGKHNDLENVGRTARHHTFFEMLGNFSFGDYFKEDAIKFAWEFLTSVIGLPKERFWITIYKDDDEAEKLWEKHTDILPGRILRFGEDENFWAMGETGPCGPCSELHYFLGGDVNNQSEEDFRKNPETYIEVWNLVFMQFNRAIDGTLTPLPKPSVDTGMGLERLAAVTQGVQANYDTDLLRNIISNTEKLSGKTYIGADYSERNLQTDSQYEIDVAMRVIADHIRAISFLIADNVNPGSDGRGYVLRRLIRRACRHGRVLGFSEPFLYQIAKEVVSLMSDTYPQLEASSSRIKKVITSEEEKFALTLDTGLDILKKEIVQLKNESKNVLPGEIAFLLHDTYGFPLDMTQDIIRSYEVSIDEEGFHSEMEKQRERSRSARAQQTEQILTKIVKPIPTEFVGYEHKEFESSIIGMFNQEGDKKTVKIGDEIALLAEQTPFYAESGGQIGDTGMISASNGTLDVIDTQKVAQGTIVHICKVMEGDISVGDSIRLSVDAERRKKLCVNHSATHLLHQALREVLGEHAVQAGSRVSDQTIRFDFRHSEAITNTQLEMMEERVNALIQDNYQVITEILPLNEAKKTGAIALFGEKYAGLVRVVRIGPGSLEFCGGTHTLRSGDVGVFAIASEGGIAAGVRRIEAYAGSAGFRNIQYQKRLIKELSSMLRSGDKDLIQRVQKLIDKNRELESTLDSVKHDISLSQTKELAKNVVVKSDGTKVITSIINNATPKQLRELADELKCQFGSVCIALGSINQGKAIIITSITSDLTSRFHAGKMLEDMAKVIGSKGGGRPDMAQAGGGDPTKLKLALERFNELIP